MTLRWQLSAVSDLAKIRDFIAQTNPAAAQFVVSRIIRSLERLEHFPNSGRSGVVQGTREVAVPGLPYIAVYTPEKDAVTVIAVFHGAQDRS